MERTKGAKGKWPRILGVAVVLAAALRTGCKISSGQPSAPMGATAAETWAIDGKSYRIKTTYFLVMQGKLQYTIEWLCDDCPAILNGIDDEKAFRAAFPLMKHAYQSNLYKRLHVTQVGGGVLEPSLIGVAITERNGTRERGYRVARTLQEVRAAAERHLGSDGG